MTVSEEPIEQKSSIMDLMMRVDKIPTNHMEVEGELCKLFYGKFGAEALPIIRTVFFEFGKHIGKKIKDQCRTDDFKILCFSYLAPALKRTKEAKLLDVKEDLIRMRTNICPWNLRNKGRELCEAMTEMDRAILDTIGNNKFKFEMIKTIASGNEYCEGIIRKIIE